METTEESRMSLAVLPTPDGLRANRSSASSISVVEDLAAAAPLWRELERSGALITPYQHFEWAAQWYEHVGRRDGATPLIVIGFDRDTRPLYMLPLIRQRLHGAQLAAFFGSSHSNLNMPVFTPAAAAELTPARLRRLLREIAAEHGIDLFALAGQPRAWQGTANPFARLAHQPSPDDVYFGTLTPEHPAPPRLPSGLRKKERQITKMEGYRCGIAADAAEVDRLLAFFRAHKAARFATRGIRNVFDDPGVMDFIAAACHDGLAEGQPVIELHALEAGGDVLAIIGAVSNRQRLSVMFSSITPSPHSRKSPGIILASQMLADCAARGVPTFDFGAGRADFKDHFCPHAEHRFDCYLPCSTRGHLLAATLRVSKALKRGLKANASLMKAISAVRRRAPA